MGQWEVGRGASLACPSHGPPHTFSFPSPQPPYDTKRPPVLLKVVGEHRAFGGWGRDKPTKKHGPLQMFSPANGVCNYLAQERIYCMLILPIPVFSPTELKGRKTIISQHGGGDGTGTKVPPSYAPGNGGMLVKSDLIFGAWGRCDLHGSLSNSAWFLYRIYFSFALLQFSSILPSFHQTFLCFPL